jgi:hypothetical protein
LPFARRTDKRKARMSEVDWFIWVFRVAQTLLIGSVVTGRRSRHRRRHRRQRYARNTELRLRLEKCRAGMGRQFVSARLNQLTRL